MKTLANIGNITSNDIVIVANNRQVIALKEQYHAHVGACFLPTIATISELIGMQHRDEILSGNDLVLTFKYLLYTLGMSYSLEALTTLTREYGLYRKHLIPRDTLYADTSSSEIFMRLIDAYEEYKHTHTLKDIYDLYTSYQSDAQHYYYGFKAFSPLDKSFIEVTHAIELPLISLDSDVRTQVYESTAHELITVCQEAYEFHAKYPHKEVAIIHPNLEEHYATLRQQLHTLYDAHTQLTADKGFNISLGRSLLSYQLCRECYVVLEAYIECSNTPADSTLHNKLAGLVEGSFYFTPHSDSIEGIVQRVMDIVSSEHIQQPVKGRSLWIEHIEDILQTLGFVSDAHLCSDEYQLLEKLKYELMCLYSNTPCTLEQCISDIHIMLSTVLFTPQSGKNQLQLMGSLEAEGLVFDAVWIMGLNSDVLPQPLQTLSYIPKDIAQQHHIPRTNTSELLKTAQANMALYRTLAPIVHFSCATTHQEEELLPSLLIEWSTSDAPMGSVHYAQKALVQDSIALSDVAGEYSKTTLSGIISVLKKQKLCPFSAFATRLGITSDEEEAVGISAKVRGMLVHKSLEYIYTDVTSHKELCSYTDNALHALITTHIARAIEYIQAREESTLEKETQELFYQLEAQELHTILYHFLQQEILREPFHIKEIEAKQSLDIAGLSSTIRIDRVDEDSVGNQIIFDYKTAKIFPKSVKESLTEPQLALYSMAYEHTALGFIELRASEQPAYKYIADSSETYLTKHTPFASYTEQFDHWQEQITQLLIQFKEGDARVTPSATACRYCELATLCRKDMH